jgi:hypothetical protein
MLQVYRSEDVFQLFEDIDNQDYLLSACLKDHNPKFGVGRLLTFDTHERYVGIASSQHVCVFSLQEKNFAQAYPKSINGDVYRQILDMQLVSSSQVANVSGPQFKMLVAVQVSGITSIHVIDLFKPASRMTIAYSKAPEKPQDLIVKVASDGKQAIFSNGIEHYIHDGGSQANFPWIKDKFIRAAIPEDRGFYLACSKDYDRDIDVLHSKRQSFHASVVKFLEPGLFKVFDMQILKPSKESKKKALQILCCVGDYLWLEVIDLEMSEVKDASPKSGHIGSHVYRFYTAYSFNWPYFAYASRYCDLFILNAFNPSFVQCYKMPKRTRQCTHSFLTDTHDFFCVSETMNDQFEIMHLDMDDPNPRLRSVFKYSFDVVGGQAIEAFHCRGSSHKEKINLNEMLVVYIMHGTDLYYWVQGNTALQLVDHNTQNLYYLSDNVLFY